MIELYFLSGSLMEVLGLTILHSIWQGAIIGVLVLLLFKSLEKADPKWRFFLAYSGIIAMFLWFSGTFLTLLEGMDGFSNSEGIYLAGGESTVAVGQSSNELRSTEPFIVPTIYAGILKWISIVWFIGSGLFISRMILGWQQLQTIRKAASADIPKMWIQKVDQLRERMGIRRPVSLLESRRISVPMLIGHVRPVILVPIGFFNGLSLLQVESIIAHELSHVRRLDYLLNWIKCGIEVILFYHPIYWWLSSRLAIEREQCCDDMVLNAGTDRVIYANALASLEGSRSGPAILAMKAFHSKNNLMHRIRRLVYPSLENETKMNRIIVVLGILMLFTLASWHPFQNNQNAPNVSKAGLFSMDLFDMNVVVDSVPPPPPPPPPIPPEVKAPESPKMNESSFPSEPPPPPPPPGPYVPLRKTPPTPPVPPKPPVPPTPALAPLPNCPSGEELKKKEKEKSKEKVKSQISAGIWVSPDINMEVLAPDVVYRSSGSNNDFSFSWANNERCEVKGDVEGLVWVDSMDDPGHYKSKAVLAKSNNWKPMTVRVNSKDSIPPANVEEFMRELEANMDRIRAEMDLNVEGKLKEYEAQQKEIERELQLAAEERARKFEKLDVAHLEDYKVQMAEKERQMKLERKAMDEAVLNNSAEAMKKIEKEMEAHKAYIERRVENFRNELESELLKDGLINKPSDDVRIQWEDSEIIINGNKLNKSQSNKYEQLLKKHDF